MTKEQWFDERISFAKPDCGLDYYLTMRDNNLVLESVCEGDAVPEAKSKRKIKSEEFPITYQKIVEIGKELGVDKSEIDKFSEDRFNKSRQS